jgi:Flp pilus assembly protein TadD/glutathione synthase/RimK-type ligase-like ATP-grasp enzyme
MVTDRPGYEGLQSALQLVEETLLIYPETVFFLFLRANLLDNLGRNEEATRAYREVLDREPAHRSALINLGNQLFLAGKKSDALKVYMVAVMRHPDDPMAHINLAHLLLKLSDVANSRIHFEYALKLDPTSRQAHMGLSHVLPLVGEPRRGTFHRVASFEGHPILSLSYRGELSPITVLILISVTGLNVRLKDFLSDRVFKIHMIATQFYDSSISLPPHQLVINALGDVDSDPVALANARSLLLHTSAPVINQPDAVLTTGRCEIARRLAAIPGVVTAKTIELTREVLQSAKLSQLLESHGLAYPILLRTPGCHGGDHFLKVDSCDELPAILEQLPGDTLIVMQYLDSRGRDGQIRKYRVMMVDGELYPLHLAISPNWKIHYFSADMADNAGHRAEDAAFLENMQAVLGTMAMTALQQIQATLGLDYAGIDFGLNDRGEVLVFEANATMAVVLPDHDTRWDYRRPAVERIYQAVSKMLWVRLKTKSPSTASTRALTPTCG